ncbi:hypothetical protein [Pseudoclavibacter sp. 13-3]|uniref:hypothetical protein n=1 Tax=Pseudoclavibacter sp. 13-3 TaxID=2901228 RepID=UPI001E63AB0A|nr:hypothetical protein [Pseudoclavibacter sp. 13-3]MCD7101325.1 hypothetical protein [Pseudoclavibacter sp. 13-3]
MHLTKAHLALILPIAALILTPLLPFVNTTTSVLGLPPILFWVGGWAIATTFILSMLYRREPELDDTLVDADEQEARA